MHVYVFATVKNLCVILDQKLTLKSHVKDELCHLIFTWEIFLEIVVTFNVIDAFITSVDYYNAELTVP